MDCSMPGLPCPSPTPGVYPSLCPLGQWCHPTVSFSVIPFSSHLQSFPASRSFPMSQFFKIGGQSTGVSASASGLPVTSDQGHCCFSASVRLWLKGGLCCTRFPDVTVVRLCVTHLPGFKEELLTTQWFPPGSQEWYFLWKAFPSEPSRPCLVSPGQDCLRCFQTGTNIAVGR